jgi:endonuclease/exonuclease/phosphatase family metal-dependent hydrolase
MNSAPCTYAYRIIRGNMQDAFLEKGFGFGQTYDAISPTLRIDVCFADKRLAVKDCFVQPLHGLSDHFPVVTTLQWK